MFREIWYKNSFGKYFCMEMKYGSLVNEKLRLLQYQSNNYYIFKYLAVLVFLGFYINKCWNTESSENKQTYVIGDTSAYHATFIPLVVKTTTRQCLECFWFESASITDELIMKPQYAYQSTLNN